ncbi:MAG TPA: heterodisulfide reductase-related iron-sulfur binding cluster [Candidatus Limnocylindria bacterium]|jgi:glycolate oxidase iron-sulfur subunit|nr:heterodisulfide reductase-related iron-sulfur binding cluster [Candidatus Limnocylindria bacterium]
MTGYPNADAPSPELLQRCVHCGFCLPTCPTYAVLGVEMDSPRGRIRLMETVWQGRVEVASDPFERHMYGCLDCRACETACPSGVEFGKLMEGARSQIEATRTRSRAERLIRTIAFRGLLPRPAVLGAFAQFSVLSRRLGAGAVLRAIGTRVRVARRLADLLELVPARASARKLRAMYPARGTRRGRVALFVGCVMRAAFADTNAATARVLARNGFEVIVPETQTCCGALHAHAGERTDARVLARRNIASLEALDVDAFIVNAAGCGAALKEYGWLLKDDAAWSERGTRFAARVKDASEFLADAGLSAAPGPLPARVAYDDPCHLLHGQRIREQPRALLAAIPELRVVPLAEADWCCGSAGTYNVTQPELSAKLLERKVGHITRSGAELVVTANPGCQMQIAAGLRAARAPVTVIHLMDLLDRAYSGAER